MAGPHPDDAFRELAARGLLAAAPAPQPLPQGNVDRRPDHARSSWRATAPDGALLKLTLASDLTDLAARHTAMAKECGALVAPPLFFERMVGIHALAEPFFAGRSVHAALATGPAAVPAVVAALARVEAILAASTKPSDENARQAEWNRWAQAVLAVEAWQPAERAGLRERVLPRLRDALATNPPVTRWSTGDLTPDNILIGDTGDVRLIDLEFAARTHFFAEDQVRFAAFSPLVRASLPRSSPSLAWHLFFWLRQYQLEATQNTPAYLTRVRPRRMGVIRRLAEQLWSEPLPDWSEPAPVVDFRLEENRWAPEQSRALFFGWARVPDHRLEGVAAFTPAAEVASSALLPRPDVALHFGDTESNVGFQVAAPLPPAGEDLILAALAADGAVLPFLRINPASVVGRTLEFENYTQWAARHDPDPVSAGPETPGAVRFSVLLPVYNPPAEVLRACLQSVRAQQHPHWELVVVDDASAAPHVAPLLREFAAQDRRVVLKAFSQNQGIARATNAALAAAQGDFIVLLDHDDLLRPHALAELARRIEESPAPDALYSDEDKITAEGRRVLPFFKPAFSPEFLLGVMYVGHVLCVRTSTARAVGGFLPEFDGIQDYEFLLRVMAATPRIGHVPRILYHWRQSPASSALRGNVKGDMDARQLVAVQQHLARTGDPRRVLPLGGHRLRLAAGPTAPATEIVTTAPGTLPDRCVATRLAPGLAPLAALRQACEQGTAEIIIFLGAMPQAWDPAWAHELAALAARPDTGCAVPILLADAGHVLAAGWTAGPAGSAPLLRGVFPGDDGYNGSLACNREVAAVSAHCVAMRRELVREILAQLALDASWLDFCLRVRATGKFLRTCAAMHLQVGPEMDGRLAPAGVVAEPDPFFNPHFDPATADYALRTDGAGPAHALQFYVDQPATWDPLPRCLIVRGWAFANTPIRAVRLQAAGLTFTGAVGLPRPDVVAALPTATDPNTGFEVRAVLPAGPNKIVLEVQLPGGQWQELVRRTGRVPPRWRPLWLGGGDWPELMFQMAAHMTYPPRPIRPEKFPVVTQPVGRPKLSIVTPSYQQARYLEETMASVLNQEVPVEYVVQDGGSTDGSVEIIRRFADSAPPAPRSTLHAPRLVAWTSGPDGGQAAAIAAGFNRTTGAPDDVMAWINSDDAYLPGALGFVADYFAGHPDVDVLYGHRVVVNEESLEVGRWFLPRHDPAAISLIDFVPQETLFWRRRVWDQVGGLSTSYKFALDWDFLLRLQAAGARIVRVPYFLACFRVHAAQKTSAAMHHIGQQEIDQLRERTHRRHIPSRELAQDPRLLGYLRRSAFIEFLWKLGFRAP